MEISSIRALRGPNIWGRQTSLEALVTCAPDACAPEAITRIVAWLPALDLSAAAPSSLDVLGRAVDVKTVPHVFSAVVRALLAAAGTPVPFSRATALATPGLFKVVVEYREEEVGRRAFAIAQALVKAALAGESFDVTPQVDALRAQDQNIRLGPSTGAIVSAAVARGIPARRLNDGSLVQFGWGARQRRILAAETDRTSAIGESIAQDKELTKSLLRSVGVPVPEGVPVANAQEAWEAAQEIGVPVVVKPQYGSQGRGVAVNLVTRDQITAAWASAREEGRSIIVEKFAPGEDYRVLVVGARVVAAALRHPPRVVGDGVRTIEELVAEVNADPRRGEDHATSLSKLKLDAIGLAVLEEQGFTSASVPSNGKVVVLRRNANLSTGGSAADVTDLVHPDVAARAVDAARIVGLDIAGIDIVCSDISRPLEAQHGVVVEVNAAPGLRMHLEPSEGRGRPVGEAIVETLFAEGETGRVPVVAITGNNGKTTTARLVAHLLDTKGLLVGLTCSDGVYIDGRRIDTGDCSGPKSARNVLLNPLVEAAVLETARGGILREGLGFDRCDVAIVTNLGEGDHLGMNGIDTIEQLAAVKRTLVDNVADGGAAVLNANDPHTAAMAERLGARAILFARDAAHPMLAAHLARGGRGLFVRDGAVLSAEGARVDRLAELAHVPLTHGGRIGFQVENVLAALGAAWHLGADRNTVRAALATFENDTKTTPGRFNVRAWGDALVVMDYGHNPDAFRALVEAFDDMPYANRTIVLTAAGDRRDVDIVRQAQIVADGFDRAIIFEDACNRGRADGEILRLLRSGLALGRRAREVSELGGEESAIEAGLRALKGGELLLVQVDQVESSLRFVERFLAIEPGPRFAPGRGDVGIVANAG